MPNSVILGIVGFASCCMPGSAQSSSQSVQPSSAIHSGWNRVQQLPPQTVVHVKTDRKKVTCRIDAVTEDKLKCSSTKGNSASSYEFSRAEINTIKLSRKGRSGIDGLAIGAGVGAGAGAGIGSAINSGNTGSFLHVSGGKSAGVGAGVGAIAGAIVGGAVFHSKDTFAPTI